MRGPRDPLEHQRNTGTLNVRNVRSIAPTNRGPKPLQISMLLAPSGFHGKEGVAGSSPAEGSRGTPCYSRGQRIASQVPKVCGPVPKVPRSSAVTDSATRPLTSARPLNDQLQVGYGDHDLIPDDEDSFSRSWATTVYW